MSRRTERIGHLIRSLVADVIQNRLADPRIPTITSVTRVEVSDDLAVARVYISALAPEPKRKLCLTALRSASGVFRRALGPQLHLRKFPYLDFRLDDSLRQGFETLEIIDRAMRELGERPTWEQADAAQDEAGDDDDGIESANPPQDGA